MAWVECMRSDEAGRNPPDTGYNAKNDPDLSLNLRAGSDFLTTDFTDLGFRSTTNRPEVNPWNPCNPRSKLPGFVGRPPL